MALAKITMLQRTLVGRSCQLQGNIIRPLIFAAGTCKPKDVVLRHVREELQRGMPETCLPRLTQSDFHCLQNATKSLEKSLSTQLSEGKPCAQLFTLC